MPITEPTTAESPPNVDVHPLGVRPPAHAALTRRSAVVGAKRASDRRRDAEHLEIVAGNELPEHWAAAKARDEDRGRQGVVDDVVPRRDSLRLPPRKEIVAARRGGRGERV
jgi:hypothetical protein